MVSSGWFSGSDQQERIIPHSAFIIYYKSVIRPLNSVRQSCRVAFMFDVVGNVSEVSATRLNPGDVLKRLIEPEMSWVFLEAKAIEHEHIKIGHCRHCVLGDFAQVSRISEVIEAIGHHRQPSMDHFKRSYQQLVAKTKRRVGNHRVRDYLRQTAAKMRRFKNIFEDATNIRPGAFIGIKAKRSIAEVQRANIVETKNVICVAMCDQNGIKAFQVVTQGLLPKIGRGINEDCLIAVFDDD